jgi:hypothetical protein
MAEPEPEPFLWMNTDDMIALSRKLGMHLFGCYNAITMRTAEENGVLSFDAAVNMLARQPHTNETQARAAVEALIAAEVIQRKGDILTVLAFGTSIVPDYDDWEVKASD